MSWTEVLFVSCLLFSLYALYRLVQVGLGEDE
jgi:hypothetical protein